MNKIKLSKRLLTIASLVDGDVVGDIGCDHGKLPYYLLKNNIVKFAYVSDISKPSLQKAEALLSSEDLKFESIYCDGLSGYDKKSLDIAIIAGMGGEEIIHIIDKSPIEVPAYILSPQHNILEVKKYMLKRGYNIIYDKILMDGHKYYNILKCVKGTCEKIDLMNLYFGNNYTQEELSELNGFLQSEKRKIEKMINKVSIQKKNKLNTYLKLIDKMQKEYDL